MLDLDWIRAHAYKPNPVERRILDIELTLANLPSLPPHTGTGPYKQALMNELAELQAQLPQLNYEMPPNDLVQS